MSEIYNVYCDESCHLENDHQQVMVLGAVWCPIIKCQEINIQLRNLKKDHGFLPNFEVKWTKISPAKYLFYMDWLDYFFDSQYLNFRALIVPDKSKLCHEAFKKQNHDNWYYKMYYDMLKVILRPQAQYMIYLDIKDTRGGSKIKKLLEILSYCVKKDTVARLQLVHSNEVNMLQLADLMIGAVSYANRNLSGNEGKQQIVNKMRERSGLNLLQTSPYGARKINLLRWQAQEVRV
jgi:hypothetical protein